MRSNDYNKKRLFLTNLAKLLIIVLIPLLILGSLSIFITQRYIKDEVNKNSRILLNQASQNINLILYELETLSMNFDINPYMMITIKSFLNGGEGLTYQESQLLKVVRSFIESSSNVKPYIHSIYTYYNNSNDIFISSVDTGVSNLNTYYDKDWYDSYRGNQDNNNIWSEIRVIQRYSFEEKKPILSLYKNFFSANSSKANGVIVLNIRMDFMEQIVSNTVTYPNQGLVVINEKGKPVISHNMPDSINEEGLESFVRSDAYSFTYTIGNNDFAVTKLAPDKYGWSYISITPHDDVYQVPEQLLLISLILLASSVLLAALLAIYMTRRNYISFMRIVKILKSAEQGRSTSYTDSGIEDEHSFIIQNIVKAFVEQKYLQMLLSERKYKMQVLELQALQSQINPHFIFNTLHAITWKAIALTKAQNEVSKMTENLSSIMKYSMENSHSTVTLEEEIRNSSCYVDILQMRYRDKFEVNWIYDPGLGELPILKLVLQPLIENSVYHGIVHKNGTGTITLRFLEDRNVLKIWVTDDGVGIPPEQLMKVRSMLSVDNYKHADQHIGLMNTNKRLMLAYGETYRIRIRSIPSKGTVIYIRIPIVSNVKSLTWQNHLNAAADPR